MFKTCSDPDFNWVHCLCDSATWVVKEPGKPIGFFYSRLFDDALSPSGLGFAVDAFRIDEDGTLDDFYSDILWDSVSYTHLDVYKRQGSTSPMPPRRGHGSRTSRRRRARGRRGATTCASTPRAPSRS